MKINLLLGKVLIFFQIFSLSIWVSELKTNLRDSKIHSSWASRRVLNYSLRRSVKFSCIFTARKRSLRRLCFTRVCLSTGGRIPGQVPPGPGTPPGTRYPLGPGTPSMTKYTLRDQVHSPWDQVHPPGAVHAGRYGQQAGGTHPTGMHSCSEFRILCFMGDFG